MLERSRAADRSAAGPETPASAEASLSGLSAGDVLALRFHSAWRCCAWCACARIALAKRRCSRKLDFDGTGVPPRDALERLGPKVNDPITFVHPLSSDTRVFAFVMERIDWQGAGFRKVQTITPRAGDEQAALPSSGISWAELAERYRRRAAL